MADFRVPTAASSMDIVPTARQHDFWNEMRATIACLVTIGFLAASIAPASAADGWSLASVNGRWSSSDCRLKYYDYRVEGREVSFREQSGAVDVERITEMRSDGFSAVTVSSSSSSQIGTRWTYTFDGNQVRIENLNSGRRFVQTRCGSSSATATAGAASTNETPANRSVASSAALTAFAAELKSFTGRWSDANCARRWNDWSILGLDISFRDQSGGVDMERVFDVLPGAFLTQSVVVGRGAQPSLWRYQPVSTDTLRVQNLTTGVTFSLQRCSSPTAVDSRRSSGAAEASSQPSGPPSALSVQNAQRDVPPQRHPTMASRALAEEGDPEDLLILANVSPDAPNAAIDLGGQLSFPSGKAVLCSGPETEPGFDARMQAARWFATRKLFSSGAITSCRETSLERLDGVVISRQSIRRLEPAWFNDVAGRLQDGRTRAFVVVSKLDLQSGVDRRELGRTVTEQAIAAGRPGFGYASVPNASATACVVADPALEPAWTAIFEQRREAISLDLGRQLHPKPLMTDADTAYIGGRRGNCGMLIANAIQLATIFKAFERDQVKGKYGAVWFTAETIQNTAAAISSGTSAALQATEKARQSAEQEQELRARREKSDGLRRDQETRQLRATFGAPAAAARDMVGTQVLALFKEPKSGSAPWATSVFPEVAREAARRASENWTYSDGSTELVEYGRSNWSGRILETAVIRIRIKLKNADIGRYDDVCYDLGYQNDVEFHRARSSKSLDCGDSGQLKKWLAGLGYESSWNAP